MIHSFESSVAQVCGVNAAIILYSLSFWIKKNESCGDNFKNGKCWTYSSQKAMRELFPYFTERQIRYAVDTLRKKGLIVTDCFNSNSFDRTIWYALTDAGKQLLGYSTRQNCQFSSDKIVSSQVTKLSNHVEDSVQDNKQDKNGAHLTKKKYGEFENVLLTETERESLDAKMGDKGAITYIERLSGYLASKGDKYKSHYATMMNWWRKDGCPKESSPKIINIPVEQPKTEEEIRRSLFE